MPEGQRIEGYGESGAGISICETGCCCTPRMHLLFCSAVRRGLPPRGPCFIPPPGKQKQNALPECFMFAAHHHLPTLTGVWTKYRPITSDFPLPLVDHPSHSQVADSQLPRSRSGGHLISQNPRGIHPTPSASNNYSSGPGYERAHRTPS